MVSEDSDEVVSGFTSIHRLHDLNDLHKTHVRLMSAVNHQLNARSELLKVELFGCSKRISPEERDDPIDEILPSMNRVAKQVFPVVVMPPVHVHLSHPKEFAQLLKTVSA
jgi:hypothetical protein